MSGCGKRHIKTVLLLLTAWLTAGCSSYIDDDLSDCPPGPNPPTPPIEQDYELNYELRLVTNITTEINTQLDTETEAYVADALRSHLSTIFTDYARDVDLSFYDTENNQGRLSHDQHEMNASERSYTLYLPIREYMHLAVANLKGNKVAGLSGDDRCPTSQLVLMSEKQDTIDSHCTGLFTARQPMKVLENVDQTFHVKLYMANCAAALVMISRISRYILLVLPVNSILMTVPIHSQRHHPLSVPLNWIRMVMNFVSVPLISPLLMKKG